MRVVFDSNVVVSGLLWGREPARAIYTAIDKLVELVATEDTLAELRNVLSRRKFAARLQEIDKTVARLMDEYTALVTMVEPTSIGSVIKEDPKDDQFLACAVGGKAVLVVSGDHHLLQLRKFQDVEIITVQEFLSRIYPQIE